MAVQIQIRRDTAANWTSNDPTLASGEIGLETDTGRMKFGDGSTAWTALDYYDVVIDHDSLTNFAANEHIDHTSVTLTAGTGLTGGGDISANRTFAVDGVLEDLDTLGANSADSEFLVGTGAGALAWENAATARTSLGLVIGTDVLAEQTIGIADDNLLEVDDADAANTDYARFTANGLQGRDATEVKTDLGLVIGTNVQAFGAVLDDLNTLGVVGANSEFLVGTGAGALDWESGATVRTSLGLGTGDSPQFTGIELGHASDTTLVRVSAGVVSIEGTNIAMVGGAHHDGFSDFAANEHYLQTAITTVGTIGTGVWEATDVAITHGGTGQSTAQSAIDALSAVSGATNEHVLTKDTATGNATWKAAAGGGGATDFSAYTKEDSNTDILLKNQVYKAQTAGFVNAVVGLDAGKFITGWVGVTATPTNENDVVQIIFEGVVTVSFQVAKDEYFEIETDDASAVNIFWKSVGTLSKPIDQT